MTNQLTRRQAARLALGMTAGVAAAGLQACAIGSSGAVALETAKSYSTTLANALSAAVQAYANQSGAVSVDKVKDIDAKLQQAAAEFAALGDTSTARSAVLSVIAFAQKLEPLVAAFLGAAAPYIPIALAVLSAFVAALPMPPDAPVEPPVQLRALAAKRR